jgi:hypothetical protein
MMKLGFNQRAIMRKLHEKGNWAPAEWTVHGHTPSAMRAAMVALAKRGYVRVSRNFGAYTITRAGMDACKTMDSE